MKRKPPPSPESLLPLPSATFDIMLAIADGERHGYAILKEVAARSGDSGQLGAGTLYGVLKRLLALDIVEEIEKTGPEFGDDRRRYYRLSAYGRAVAKAEAQRLGSVVREARRKRLIGRLA